MTTKEKIIKFIKSYEGGFVNDPHDKGGATCKGVTWRVFRPFFKAKYGKEPDLLDLKRISDTDWEEIFTKGYFDKVRGAELKHPSVCALMVDFAYNSGALNAIKTAQKALGLVVDGILGAKTLAALNEDEAEVFAKLHKARLNFFAQIVRNNPTQRRFINGWTRRVMSIEIDRLNLNNGKVITL